MYSIWRKLILKFKNENKFIHYNLVAVAKRGVEMFYLFTEYLHFVPGDMAEVGWSVVSRSVADFINRRAGNFGGVYTKKERLSPDNQSSLLTLNLIP